MYYLRGLFVSLSVLVLLYAIVSLLVGCAWRRLLPPAQHLAPSRAANAMYALRTSPLWLSVAVVLGFSVPSFLCYEPRASGEALGAIPVLLSVVFGALVAVGAARAWNAHARTRRLVRQWLRETCLIETRAGVEILRGAADAPLVALAGITRPALVISESASASLTPQELSRTVAHELAHQRAHDNLKKLLLLACFPRMAAFEAVWREVVEFSADTAAVHSESEALDLASALVKISRLSGGSPLPELASSLVEGPSSLLEARVQRLIEWRVAPRVAASFSTRAQWIAFVTFAAAGLTAAYPSLLRAAHAITEFLVR